MVNVYVENRTAQALVPFDEFCKLFHISLLIFEIKRKATHANTARARSVCGISNSQAFQSAVIIKTASRSERIGFIAVLGFRGYFRLLRNDYSYYLFDTEVKDLHNFEHLFFSFSN